jgi:hypothetical protein
LREKKHFKIYGNFTINTHYIHSVVVQDFVSGRVCNVNQYHYGCDAVSSRNRQDLIHSLVPPHYVCIRSKTAQQNSMYTMWNRATEDVPGFIKNAEE